MNEAIKLAPAGTDQQNADAIKARMREAANLVGKIMDDAKAQGLILTFQFGPTVSGFNLTALQVSKEL